MQFIPLKEHALHFSYSSKGSIFKPDENDSRQQQGRRGEGKGSIRYTVGIDVRKTDTFCLFFFNFFICCVYSLGKFSIYFWFSLHNLQACRRYIVCDLKKKKIVCERNIWKIEFYSTSVGFVVFQ